MKPYSIALFLHVCGAIGLFVGIGTLYLATSAMRRTRSVDQIRTIARMIVEERIAKPEPLSLIDLIVVGGVLIIVITGLYMALTTWGLRTGWIAVALASVVLIGPVGPFVINPRLRTIAAAAEESSNTFLPEQLRLRVHDPVLGIALHVLATWLFGIVLLMTNKPSLTGSIGVMILALLIGLVSAIPFWREARRV